MRGHVRRLVEPIYNVDIFIAGDLHTARHAIRKFCLEGLCVSITATDFAYTCGLESGVKVGLVNYPRFPNIPEKIQATAERLAMFLMNELVQSSALVITPDNSVWLTTREEQ